MKEELSGILKANALEYFNNGLEDEQKKQYNSSVTLFFKAISALTDLFLLIKEGKMSSNHSERFRVLQTKYPELYAIMDKDFPFYQDSYRARLNKEVSEMLKNDAKRIFEILDIRI